MCMKPLRVVGPSDSGKTTLVERLVDRLDDRGSVATIKHCRTEPTVDTEGKDTARHRAAGADRTEGIVDDGSWFATGAGRDLETALDDLAVEHDYVLVEGYGDADLPTVALAGRDHGGETVHAAPEADAADVEAVLAAIEAVEPHETLESLVQRVRDSPREAFAGAIGTFTGRVRARDGEDDPRTERLEFEKYDGVADERMDAIEGDIEAREGVLDCLLYHRTGVVEAGEDIVHVVVLAGHRREAFRAVEDGIDRLKEEVPLFKREVTVEGADWAHERDASGD